MNLNSYIGNLTYNHVTDKHGNLLCRINKKVSYNKDDAANKYCHACRIKGVHIAHDKVVKIRLKNMCNKALCNNRECIEAGTKIMYSVVYQGTFRECEDYVSKEYDTILRKCLQLSTGLETAGNFLTVTESKDRFVILHEGGSHIL